jgi:hypothetical protein
MSKSDVKRFQKQRAKVLAQNKKTIKQEHKETKTTKPKGGDHNGYYWAWIIAIISGFAFLGWAAYYWYWAIYWSINVTVPDNILGILGWAGYGAGVSVTLYVSAVILTIIALVILLVVVKYCKRRMW